MKSSLVATVAVGLTLAIALPVSASPSYHIEAVAKAREVCQLTEAYTVPAMNVTTWAVIAPRAPELPSQGNVASSLSIVGSPTKATKVSDLSAEPRPLLQLLSPGASGHRAVVQATYTATLYRRRLLPGAPSMAVEPLSPEDTKRYTRSTPTLDYGSPTFQAWLDRTNLRQRGGLDTIAFARRVYDAIRPRYTYLLDDAQDRRASLICGTDWTDCGGLCGLFVSAMRANGVPARMLVGWTAKPDSPRGHPHVRCEFYAEGVGWVPVEMSAAVYFKRKPVSESFGYDAGDFLVLHIDPDLEIDTVVHGKISCPGLQTPAHAFAGVGTLDGATDEVTWTAHRTK